MLMDSCAARRELLKTGHIPFKKAKLANDFFEKKENNSVFKFYVKKEKVQKKLSSAREIQMGCVPDWEKLFKMTDFEKKVLEVVSRIPLGQVRSYKWVARKVGRPKAYRAVANALAKNIYPLFIPCHRVIKSSKELGGYSLGPGLKEKLINLEKKIRDMIK